MRSLAKKLQGAGYSCPTKLKWAQKSLKLCYRTRFFTRCKKRYPALFILLAFAPFHNSVEDAHRRAQSFSNACGERKKNTIQFLQSQRLKKLDRVRTHLKPLSVLSFFLNVLMYGLRSCLWYCNKKLDNRLSG